ncbi:hypothetical protein [Aeromonas veronii]|uniref:hypothetical protein n=1 Tax=Aeromonas veronii TaxID=654 RepID=UPI0011160288|nr:hypothetical protein [Aeromonas veronii]
MNTIKFNAAQQAEVLAFSAFWAESQRHDYLRLYRLQARLARLRIVRRVSGTHDRHLAQTLLAQCRLARASLRHAHAQQTYAGGQA